MSGDRVIELKAFGSSARGTDIWLEPNQYNAALDDPDHFWLYVVENVRQGGSREVRVAPVRWRTALDAP